MNDDVPKSAAVYQRAGKAFMHPWAETTQGISTFTEPVLVASELDRELAGQLLAMLAKSGKKVPHPTSWTGSLHRS
jgi:hypothetical protein